MSEPSQVRLRDLRWQDLEAVDQIERALFGRDAWSPAGWWSELAARPLTAYWALEGDGDAPHRAVVGARDDADPPGGCGELLGYAGLARSRPVADVMTIAVCPHVASRGYGRLLLDRLIRDAADAGAEALMLEVRADNTAARALYAAAGFDQVSVRRRYYQPDGVDALILRRHLAPGTPVGPREELIRDGAPLERADVTPRGEPAR